LPTDFGLFDNQILGSLVEDPVLFIIPLILRLVTDNDLLQTISVCICIYNWFYFMTRNTDHTIIAIAYLRIAIRYK